MCTLSVGMESILKQALEESKKPQKKNNIPFLQVVISVIQASFGVQNASVRERDFKHGKLISFIFAAILFTAVLVLALVFVVKLVLDAA